MNNELLVEYLAIRRKYIAIDEWLGYAAIVFLYWLELYSLFGIGIVIQIISLCIAYPSYWELMRKVDRELLNPITPDK